MKKSYERGVTLAEIIVVSALIGLLSIAVGTFARDVFYLSSVNTSVLSAATDARAVVKVLARDLRTMSIGGHGGYPIANAATNTISFFSDIDGDNVKEQVRYFVASSSLRKGVIEPSGNPVVYNVANETQSILVKDLRNGTTSLFEYYDTNYAGTTSPMTYPLTITGVRLIKVTIMVDADPNRAPVVKTYTTQVSLRNLKDNL